MKDYDASGQAVGQLVYLPASGQGLRQSGKKLCALDQAVGQLEDLHVPGQAVGQLNDVLFPVIKAVEELVYSFCAKSGCGPA